MTGAPTAPDGSAARRRTRYGLMTGALVLATTASCVIVAMLAAAHPIRFDATATREHTLSPRTEGLLARLTEPCEIIVVADLPSLNPAARDRVNDLLTEFAHASPNVAYNRIDAVATSDRASYVALLDRLARLKAEQLERHRAAAEAAAETTRALGEGLNRLSDGLLALRDELARAGAPADAPTGQMTDAAAAARTWSGDLRKVGDAADAALSDRIAGSSIPPVDRAEQALAQPLRRLAHELDGLRAYLERLAQTAGLSDAARAAAEAAKARTVSLRDAAARAADGVERLGSPDLLAIVRTLEAGPAVVIVSRTGATAVNFEALFPTSQRFAESGQGQGDLLFVGEELIGAAIGALSNPRNPIVVLVDASPQRLLDDAGQPASDEARSWIGKLVQRLRLRGVDLREWSVGTDDGPPPLTKLDPKGDRPVVWVTLPVANGTADGADRSDKLVRAVQGLIDRGAAVLLSVNPSTLPGVGEADPVAALAAPFGMSIDTGRPLMQRRSVPGGWSVSPALVVVGESEEHPIGRAVRGLDTLLPWPVAIALAPAEGAVEADAARTWPILQAAASDDTWGEAQWLEFRSMSQSQRGMVANPPTPDPKWDAVVGPWVVAAAAERPRPGGAAPQRFVAVGSNGWFFDEPAQRTEQVQGRTALVFPGNGELFEGAMYWLAGADDMIGASPRSRTIARIAPLSPGQLAALRWALIAGVPALTLGLGIALRLLRG